MRIDKGGRISAAFVLAAALTACGGGGDSSVPETDDGTTTIPPGGGTVGTLTVTGPGAASVQGDFRSDARGAVSTAGPDCTVVNGSSLCTSSFAIGWTESSAERMVVILSAAIVPAPGAAPGADINSINLLYSVFGSNGFGLVCGPIVNTTCDFASLGITLDTTKKTLTFVDTPFASAAAGGDGVVVNGVLAY